MHCPVSSMTPYFYYQKGNGYVEVPPTDILSFSSPEKDAALTFINSTTVNGVLVQNGHAFDVVASDDLLRVIFRGKRLGKY